MKRVRVSFFKKAISDKPYNPRIPLTDVHMILTEQFFKASSETLGQIEDPDQKLAFQYSRFPVVTFSGIFDKKRDSLGLVKHPGLIALEIITHEPPPETLKTAVLTDRYFETEMAFTSISGKSLIWVIAINLKLASHQKWFSALERYIASSYGYQISQSAQWEYNITFLHYEPTAYIHPRHLDESSNQEPPYRSEKKLFIPDKWLTPEETTEASTCRADYPSATDTHFIIEKIIRQAETSQIDLTRNHRDWEKLGLALAAEFGEAGREYFHRISKMTDYNGSLTDQQYDKYLRSKQGAFNLNTFLRAAQAAGLQTSNF